MDESIVKEFEQQQLSKLSLSQAIRLGATLRPECRLYYAHKGASCAVMAAAEATGFPYIPSDSVAERMHQHNRNYFGSVYSEVYIKIMVWMDRDRLTREQIAELLKREYNL